MTCQSKANTGSERSLHHRHEKFFGSNASGPAVDSKVLLFVETQYSLLGRQIVEVLEASRIKFKIEISGKSLPVLTNMEKGKFAVIVFENYDRYIRMNKWNRELLDKYCSEFDAGIIGFMPRPKSDVVSDSEVQMKGFPISIRTERGIRKYVLNTESPVLRITKGGEIPHTLPEHVRWTSFHFNHSSYLPVAQDIRSDESGPVPENMSASSDSDYDPIHSHLAAIVQVSC